MEDFQTLVERHSTMKTQLAMTELEAACLHLLATIEEARKVLRKGGNST